MLIIFLGIFTVVRQLFKKALFGMVPKPVPMVSVARRVLLAKQADPTLVTVLGIVRVVKAQLANAKLSIVVTVAGIVNAVSGQNSKAAPEIVVIPVPIVKVAREALLAKQEVPILVTVLGIVREVNAHA
jgi:hypothetical protein